MSLIRWEPFTDADDLFSGLVPEYFGRWPRLRMSPALGRKLDWSPTADISETEQEFVIRAQLPGVKKEDVKVNVKDGVITIEGERKQQHEEKTEKMHRVESIWGNFSRSFSLPENANAESIRCETKDGVLTVHIPKLAKAEGKVRQIKVE